MAEDSGVDTSEVDAWVKAGEGTIADKKFLPEEPKPEPSPPKSTTPLIDRINKGPQASVAPKKAA